MAKVVYFSDIVVLACGVVNFTALMFALVHEKHFHDLTTHSEQLGRNFMSWLMTVILDCEGGEQDGGFFRRSL